MTSIMIHNRFTNLPLPLIGALHRNLEEDISWAKQQANNDSSIQKVDNLNQSSDDLNSQDNDKNDFGVINFIILLSTCTFTEDSQFNFDGNNSNKSYNVTGNSSIIFDLFEDECYFQNCSSAVLFKCKESYYKDSPMVAMLIPISKLTVVINSIMKLTNNET